MVGPGPGVSLLHNKFTDSDGTSYDLTYITSQLIASAMPTDSMLKSLYRTKARKLVTFLNTRHGNKWRIWNFQEDHEIRYDVNNIGNSGRKVRRAPTPDHGPFPMATLVGTVVEINDFLTADPENVALVHCKWGKGRTGSMVCAYLMLFQNMTYKKAIEEFTKKRIKVPIFDGVSIKSQIIYLRYLQQWIINGYDKYKLKPVEIEIVKVVLEQPFTDHYSLVIKALTSSSESKEQPKTVMGAISTVHTKYDPDSLGTSSTGRNSPLGLKRFEEKLLESKYKGPCILITRKNTSVLQTLSANRTLPADISIEFTGYAEASALKVPTSFVATSANVLFESQISAVNRTPEPMKETSVYNLVSTAGLDSEVYSFSREWADLDGSFGLNFKGLKAFGSIEVFWKFADEPEGAMFW